MRKYFWLDIRQTLNPNSWLGMYLKLLSLYIQYIYCIYYITIALHCHIFYYSKLYILMLYSGTLSFLKLQERCPLS